MSPAPPTKEPSWRFPAAFWSANVAELFERAAYYGVFIGLAVYLSKNYGFSDVGAGYVGAYFSAAIYFVPTFAGALADRMGFRRAMLLAYGCLTVGYAFLGLFGTPPMRAALGTTGAQLGALFGLTIVIVGGAFVKAVVTGTVARSSDDASRARGFSIFYLVVNVGSFTGKTLAYPLRVEMGLEYVSFFSATMGLLGFLTILVTYRGLDALTPDKSLRDVARSLARVLRNGRFVGLILIVAGFWIIQGQLYAAMPKYILRTVGDSAKPEWLANVNPLVVVLFVVPVTHLVRRFRAVTSIGIALAMVPLSALTMALAPLLAKSAGAGGEILGMHPVTLSIALGTGLQGLAECFLSPRYFEFASKQAPPGEEGLYMGFAQLHTFVAWFIGFILSGYLLEAYCPDPATLPAEEQAAWRSALATGAPLPDAYANAHVIWYIFACIGAAAFALLHFFRWATDRADRRRESTPGRRAPG